MKIMMFNKWSTTLFNLTLQVLTWKFLVFLTSAKKKLKSLSENLLSALNKHANMKIRLVSKNRKKIKQTKSYLKNKFPQKTYHELILPIEFSVFVKQRSTIW